MTSETPVIAFDIPGPRGYVVNGYNDFLVRSLDEMVEKISTPHTLWKSGPEECLAMCKNAHKTAERFDRGLLISRLEKMFHAVMDQYNWVWR